MKISRVLRVALALFLPLGTACYSNVPIARHTITAEMDVVLDLTDQGTADIANWLGTGIVQVRGKVIEARADSTRIAVTSVLRRRGVPESWNGAHTMFPTRAFGRAYERRFDRRKTIMVALGSAVGVVLIGRAAGLDGILGIGGNPDPVPPQ